MLKVHHLRIGRSIFTVWLLEELGAPYELEIYVRNEMGRAPPELKNAHPLGKSPVIEDDGFILAESGAIALYLLEKFDPENKLGPPQGDAKAKAEWMQWLMYSEASAFAPLLMKLLLSRTEEKPPVFDMFATGEVALQLGYLEDRLSNREFVMGDRFQAPDIGTTYIAQMAERLGEIGPYPALKAYLDRNIARPAFQRAAEKTGG
ncbi:MAG: glutathione S-transferase family protein [Hyphomonadaceae bacterium]|nr:glutathione S-transferase family protein [Hyphomonadaceae bacterium]